jgi:hypothetical protein
MPDPPADVWLHLRPLPARPGEPPADQRLRALLKVALRRYRLRCEELRDAAPPDEPRVVGET